MDKLLPKFFLPQFFTALPLAAVIISYFYFLPTIPFFLIPVFFGFWVLGFLLDVKTTIKRSQLIPKHEINIIFPILCSRFGLKLGCLVQFLLEVMVVIFLPTLFIYAFHIAASSIMSAMFGASHMFASYSNKKITL